MLIVLITTLLLSSNASAYLSYGDASDDCNWTAATVTLEKPIWNCDDLTVATGTTVNVNTSKVTELIQLRVQGDVDIDGTITVAASGTTAGPGGSNGGTCSSAPCSSPATDAPGSTGGEGNGGGAGDNNSTFNIAYGGGGGGAGFSINGDNADTTPPGTNIGQIAGTPGTGGTSFFSSSDLDSSIRGGVGGGAGGSGDNGTFTAVGGAGGAGAGSLLIVAKGNIILRDAAKLDAKGGVGLVPTDVTGVQGGNGGGGSGGIIYIVTSGSLTLSGTPEVDITGGDAQTGGSGGPGGKGSDGILRVDTSSGSFSGSFTLPAGSPAANTNTTPSNITDPLSGSSSESLVSDISPNCTYKEGSEKMLLMLLLSFLISLSLLQAYKLRW